MDTSSYSRRRTLGVLASLSTQPFAASAMETGSTDIIDIHAGVSIDLAAVKASGTVAVIHKATEGGDFRDKQYLNRRRAAKDAELLWGSYHFSNSTDVSRQIKNYLSYANPQDDEVMCLDFEHNKGNEMSLAQAETWIEQIQRKTGRYPLLYGGAWLREQASRVKSSSLSNCPLWYRRYASRPIAIPTHLWPDYTLWQYTDGKDGAEPKVVNGIRTDRSHYKGSNEQLRSAWPFTKRSGA